MFGRGTWRLRRNGGGVSGVLGTAGACVLVACFRVDNKDLSGRCSLVRKGASQPSSVGL